MSESVRGAPFGSVHASGRRVLRRQGVYIKVKISLLAMGCF